MLLMCEISSLLKNKRPRKVKVWIKNICKLGTKNSIKNQPQENKFCEAINCSQTNRQKLQDMVYETKYHYVIQETETDCLSLRENKDKVQ